VCVLAIAAALRGAFDVSPAHFDAPLPAVGCSDPPAQPASPPPIEIGVSLALGDSFGLGLKSAIVVAEGVVNANGGLLGRPVRFKVVDDKGDEGAIVLGVASGFVKDGVPAVIGPIGSDQVLATQAALAKAHIIQLAPGATAPALTTVQQSSNRFLYRTTPADDIQARAVVLFARSGPTGPTADAGAPLNDAGTGEGGVSEGGVVTSSACSRMAIFSLSNTYGNAMSDAVDKLFTARGGTIVKRLSVDSQVAASYEKEVAEVLSVTPDCIGLIVFADVGARFMIDLRKSPDFAKLPPSFFIVGTDGVYTQDFIDMTQLDPSNAKGTDFAEGTFGTTPDTNPTARPEYEQFRTLYRTYFPGQEPGSFAANTFDAAMLAALAIGRAGTATPGEAIRNALKEVSRAPGRAYGPAEISDALTSVQHGMDIDYNGASGQVDLDDDGNVLGDFILWTVARDPKTGAAVFKTLRSITADELR
jgi:branched-chain amino acid transport system substrate-binding protein/neutral amino acid transport system substrate-binding protein